MKLLTIAHISHNNVNQDVDMSWEVQTRDVIKPRLEPDFEKVADLYCVLVYKVRVQSNPSSHK